MPPLLSSRNLRTFILTLALISLGITALAQTTSCNTSGDSGGTGDAGAPCFANNRDILNGQRSLLDDDDLLLAGNLNNGDSFLSNSTIIQTADSIGFPQTDELFLSAGITSNTIAQSARMFNQVPAVAVSGFAAFGGQGGGSVSTLYHQQGVNYGEVDLFQNLGVTNGCLEKLYSVAADFTGNGTDDVVYGLYTPGCNSGGFGMSFQAVAAVDPNNTASGFQPGPASAVSFSQSSLYALAAGTFADPPANGAPPSPLIAQLTSIYNTGLGLEIGLFAVDPTTLAVTYTGKFLNLTLPEGNSANIAAVAIASGRFSGATHDQLAVAYAVFGGHARIITVDFDANGNPVQERTYDTGVIFTSNSGGGAGYPGSLILQKGRFNFFAGTDQAALSLVPGQNNVILEVLSFDSMLTTTEGPRYTPPGACHYGMAAGRYDRYVQPLAPVAVPDPNFQIADLSTGCSSKDPMTLNIYNVDPGTFTITTNISEPLASNYASGSPFYSTSLPTDNSLQAPLAAVDYQGRSLVLGPPEKATITGHVQPDTVLGLPPMHVDFVVPEGNFETPSVVNVSVYPRKINTSYNFSSSVKGQASTSQTTSYTVATKEMASEKVSYGIPSANFSIAAQQALGQMHQNSIAKKYNTYSGTHNNINVATGFDDLVAATINRMNIYSYRVIGQCSPSPGAVALEDCPAGTAPYYVQFSAPDEVYYLQFADGATLPWYQPVQEPGNIFSYPGNVTLLEAQLPSTTPLQPLTPLNSLLTVPTSQSTSINWTQGNQQDVTSGSVSSHSFDASVSVSGSVNIGLFSASASVGFDYNHSSSLSTVNQSTNTQDSSEGITVNLNTTTEPTNSDSGYEAQSLIFGQQAPQGLIQNDITQTAQIQATGFLDVGWIADPLATGAFQSGGLWGNWYSQYPDVALNHPQRWSQKYSYAASQEVWFNCPVGYALPAPPLPYSPACAPQTPPEAPSPGNIGGDYFYRIKGLFVTPGGATDGPQITRVTPGSAVNLKVRVYNYSLYPSSMLAGVTLRVQFYAQPIDPSIPGNGTFLSAPGNPNAFANAVFIGEGTDSTGTALTPPPPFCGGASTPGDDPCASTKAQPNWEFAYTSWNTPTATSFWKFWVVTWLENSNGTMVPEQPEHGLPAATLAKCLGKPGTPCFSSLGDVAVASTGPNPDFEIYSNNFGFYNQIFAVAPANLPGSSSSSGVLSLLQVVSLNGPTLVRNQPAQIAAYHQATGRSFDDVLAIYYDGDPDKGGVQYDTKSIPHIDAEQTYLDPGSYVPTTCGKRQLFVRSIPLDGSSPTVTASTNVNVTINGAESVEETINYIQGMTIDQPLKTSLLGILNSAETSFLSSQIDQGRNYIEQFLQMVQQYSGKITTAAIETINNQENDLLVCTVQQSDGPDMSLSLSAGTAQVSSGKASSAIQLQVSSVNGLAGAVQFSCIGLPAGTSCTFNPAQANVAAGGTLNSSFTVSTSTTTAASSFLPSRFGVPFLAALLLLLARVRSARKRVQQYLLFLLLLAVSIGGTIGCGSSSKPVPTPVNGTFSVLVSATSGTLVRTTPLVVTINNQ
jgi:hypothetical protein